MIHYYVSIAERSLLCHGNNITRFNSCSYQAMIQLVKPEPRLAKCYVKNRGVWEGVLIIWVFSELIYIITGTHNTGLAVEQIVVSRKALHCYLIAFLSACVNGPQTTVISKHFRLSERVKRLETYSSQGTIVQSAA